MQRRQFAIALIASAFALSASHTQETYQAEAERLAQLLNWQPGSVVADIGAGDGEMTLAAAEHVGPTGRVFTTELDPDKLARLEKIAAESKNITAVRAAAAATNLPPACCDSILLRRVYHHFAKPAEIDANLFRTLRPGGRLAVIDFAPREGLPEVQEDVPENRGGHGVPQQIVVEELTAAGFEVATVPDDWPNDDYCVIFRKPGG
ncbi:MAG: methyltransferase domain-containing protein [Acidobacteria bacterium]|nr:methyltransferase domain-containing protein [Acidobacteriota bacterium]